MKPGDTMYAARININGRVEVEGATIKSIGAALVEFADHTGQAFGCARQVPIDSPLLAPTRSMAIERIRRRAVAELKGAQAEIDACDAALAKESRP